MTLSKKETTLKTPFEEYFHYSNVSSSICQSLQITSYISDLKTLKLLCDSNDHILLIVDQVNNACAMNSDDRNLIIKALNNIKDKSLEDILSWIDVQNHCMLEAEKILTSLNLPSDPKQMTAYQQRVLMKYVDKQSLSSESDIFYILSNAWYYKWCQFTKYSLTDKIIFDCELSINEIFHTSVSRRPPPIYNYVLQDMNNQLALKPNLNANEYIIVNAKKWELFHSWFGGGPVFKRMGNSVSDVNLYPHYISTVECNADGIPDEMTFKLREYYPQKINLRDVANTLTMEYFGNVDESTPFIHFWLQLGSVLPIYPISTKNCTVTKEEVEEAAKEHPGRYVEMPDDYMKSKLCDFFLPEKNIFKSVTIQQCIVHGYIRGNSFSAIPLEVIQLILTFYEIGGSPFLLIEKKNLNDGTWPRAKTDENWTDFKIGDFLDVLDEKNKWYECVIRKVDKLKNELCVHCIGWNIKWDEIISADPKNGRIAKRNTHTTGPHRPKKS